MSTGINSLNNLLTKIKIVDKKDIVFTLSAPSTINLNPYPLESIIRSITLEDPDFPILNFNAAKKVWEVSKNNIVIYDGQTRILWTQCIFEPVTFMNIFRQGGWEIILHHWEEYLDLSSVIYD